MSVSVNSQNCIIRGIDEDGNLIAESNSGELIAFEAELTTLDIHAQQIRKK